MPERTHTDEEGQPYWHVNRSVEGTPLYDDAVVLFSNIVMHVDADGSKTRRVVEGNFDVVDGRLR